MTDPTGIEALARALFEVIDGTDPDKVCHGKHPKKPHGLRGQSGKRSRKPFWRGAGTAAQITEGTSNRARCILEMPD
jgi:hypothetical protein